MRHPLCILLAVGYIVLFSACNATRIVKPLAQKEVAVGLDIGGPVVSFGGAKIPTPLSSITVGYGVDSTFTAYGGFHVTSAIFGTIQWDLGVLKEIVRPQKGKGYIPGLSVGAGTQMAVDVFEGAFRLYPTVDINLYWQYLPKHQHYFYFNWGSWFDFWDRAHNQPNTNVYYPSLSLGHTFDTKKMRYTLEAKYMAFNERNGWAPIKFNGSGGQGAWGFYLSIYRKF